MPQSPHSSNLLLASLPPENIVALMPHLRVVELPHEAVLFEAGDTIKALYFPHNGIVSILVDLSSGEMIERERRIGRWGRACGETPAVASSAPCRCRFQSRKSLSGAWRDAPPGREAACQNEILAARATALVRRCAS
jgi:hypothetical protein